MSVPRRQSPIELEHIRKTFDRRLHEIIQRMDKKLREISALVQELVVDPASGNPDEIVGLLVATIPLAPVSHGNFTVLHGIGSLPQAVVIEMTSAGLIWFQTTKYDVDNLYLVASDTGLTADAKIIY